MGIQRSPLISKRATGNHRKRNAFYGGVVLIIVACIVMGIVWLSRIDRLQINDVQVKGASEALTKEIVLIVEEKMSEKTLWLLPKRNAFLFSEGKMEDVLLDKYPRIKSISVDSMDFSKIIVTVVEREPEILWCRGYGSDSDDNTNDCYFVDKTGYVYIEAPYFSDHVYFELYGFPLAFDKNVEATTSLEVVAKETAGNSGSVVGTQLLPKETFVLIMSFVRSLEQISIGSYSLTMRDEDLFEISMDNGGVLKFSPTQNLLEALRNLKTAYEKKFTGSSSKTPSHIEYIDIRFANKVLFKFTQ